MDPRLPRILAIGLAACLAAGLLLWNSLSTGGGIPPTAVVPPLIILLAGLVLVFRIRRRDDPSGTLRRAANKRASALGAVIGALVAVGVVLWGRSQEEAAGSPAADGSAHLVVLGAIVLVGVVMILVKRMKEDRDQRPR